MYTLKMIFNRGWSPIVITVLAIMGLVWQWSVWALATGLVVILVIGLIVAAVNARERELERLSQRLRQLIGYFNRRFMGTSSLSIFAMINSLFNVDDPKLWDWARSCDMSQRIFNTWCSSFVGRAENDIKIRRFDIFLRTYLNELWQMNDHYYEFVEQFYEIASKVEIPKEASDQYGRFVTEYNAFAQDFRESVSELKCFTKTGIEPPSVKFAKEISVAPSKGLALES